MHTQNLLMPPCMAVYPCTLSAHNQTENKPSQLVVLSRSMFLLSKDAYAKMIRADVKDRRAQAWHRGHVVYDCNP